MDAIASALLLAAFILFVDLTFGEGNHRAAQLGGLFSSRASVGWPAGVQEEDHPWLVMHRVPMVASAGTVFPVRQARSHGSRAEDLAPRSVFEGPYAAGWVLMIIEETDDPVT